MSIREDYERGIGLYNAGDIDAYANEYADDAILVTPNITARGRAEIHNYWSRQKAAFPGCRLSMDALVEQGDTIACEWTWTGTHAGPLGLADGRELSPTGKTVEQKGMELVRMRDGKVQLYHIYWDGMALYRQLGLL